MYEYLAKLVKVVDGDTVRLELDLGFRLSRCEEPYRLLRIDAPEIETAEGKAAREALQDFLRGKTLVVRTQKSDSFGRWLAELYADAVNVSDWLVEHGHARYRKY